jgi:hypothetical protein
VRLAYVVAAALAASSCATAPRAPDEGGPTWFMGEGPHVIVRTDLDGDAALMFLNRVEVWREAITAALFPDAEPPTGKLEVLVLGSRELTALIPYVDGFFTNGKGSEPLLVLGAREAWDRTAVMKHELAHAVIAENLARPPKWLNEGLATLLETANLDEKAGKMSWGALPVVGTGYIRYPLSPMPLVLDDRAWTSERYGRFEYSSQFLVYALLKNHPAVLSCVLSRLEDDDDFTEARRVCFDEEVDWGRLYSSGHLEFGGTYVASARIGRGEGERAGPRRVRPMAAPDVHRLLARLNRVAATYLEKYDSLRQEVLAAAEHHEKRAGTGPRPASDPRPPGPQVADEDTPPWFEASSEHLVVVSDVGAELAAGVVRPIQRLRHAMHVALLSGAAPPDQDLGVVVLRDGELKALGAPVASLFSDQWFLGPFIVLEARDASGATTVMKREIARAVVAADLPDAPPWLADGLVARLSEIARDSETGEVAWDPPAGDSPARRPTLKCLLGGLAKLEGYDRALDRCVPARDGWPRSGAQTLGGSGPLRKVGPLAAPGPVTPVRPLSSADIHAWRALVDQLASKDRAAEAKQHRDRALALDPTQILAASMLLRDVGGPQGQARWDLVDRVIAAHPGDWRAWFQRGGDFGPNPAPEVRNARKRAAALAPRRPEVLLLEAIAAHDDMDWKASELFARQAATDPMQRPYLTTLILEAVEQQGRCDEARTMLANDPKLAKSVASDLDAGKWADGQPMSCLGSAAPTKAPAR